MSVAETLEKPWTIVVLEKAFQTLRKAADDLCFVAEISGGTAGRDEHLCAAIANYAAERDKAAQMVRIVHFEWNDPEIGAGHRSLDQFLSQALERVDGEGGV